MLVSHRHLMDQGTAVFDDEHLVADAGLGVVGLLVDRLGIEAVFDRAIGVGARPGRKAVTVIMGMVAGADSIDDLDILRSGSTDRMLPCKVMAPSTIGTWLREMGLGQIAQLDSALGASFTAAWHSGAGPAPGADVTLDLDSSIKPVGTAKEGAAYAYNGEYGLHPQFVTLRETGEQVVVRLREGSANAGRGAKSLVRTSIHRVRRAAKAPLGRITIGGDSAFYQTKVFDEVERLKAFYSISARDTQLIAESMEAIPERAWRSIEYKGGLAQVAEMHMPRARQRLIVRRVKNVDSSKRRIRGQAQLFDTWRLIPFVTNLPGDMITLDAEHRRRARQELSFADLKDNALNHLPSNKFVANAAWLTLAAIAQNLVRWTVQIGLGIRGLVVTRTIRRRLLAIPGRLTRSARRYTLHLPKNWPWRHQYLRALRRIRGIPRIALQPK